MNLFRLSLIYSGIFFLIFSSACSVTTSPKTAVGSARLSPNASSFLGKVTLNETAGMASYQLVETDLLNPVSNPRVFTLVVDDGTQPNLSNLMHNRSVLRVITKAVNYHISGSELHIASGKDLQLSQLILAENATAPDGPTSISTTPCNSANLHPLNVPALHSLHGAPVSIYLNFAGSTTNFGGLTGVITPPFDTDNDPQHFNDCELQQIQNIYLNVADAYSPFKIDVTTVPPDSGGVTEIEIGGNGQQGTDPCNGNPAGCAMTGGVGNAGAVWTSSYSNPMYGYVFTLNSAGAPSGSVNDWSEAIVHEAGHTLGLYHQSLFNSSCGLQYEYYMGSQFLQASFPAPAPFMGASTVTFNRWYYGHFDNYQTPVCNSQGQEINWQDDMAVISQTVANTISPLQSGSPLPPAAMGFRVSEQGASSSNARPITENGQSPGTILVQPLADNFQKGSELGASNFWSFSTGATQLTITVTNVWMLQPTLTLESSDGAIVAQGQGRMLSINSSPSYSSSLSANVAAGNYILVVSPAPEMMDAVPGEFGFNVGNYNLSISGLTATSTSSPSPSPSLVSLQLSPSAATIREGQNESFTAVGTYSDGSTRELTNNVTWTSSNPSIATINASGLANSMVPGGVNISANIGSVSATVPLTVVSVPQGTEGPTSPPSPSPSPVPVPPGLIRLQVGPIGPTISLGQSQSFTATGTFADGSTQNLTNEVTWTSSNASVANINSSGAATSVSSGATVIFASYQSNAASVLLTVTAAAAASPGPTTVASSPTPTHTPAPRVLVSLRVSPIGPTIGAGQSLSFTATGTYSDGSTENLTNEVKWTSSNPSVATITASGYAQSVGAGSCVIFASYGSSSASVRLTVTSE